MQVNATMRYNSPTICKIAPPPLVRFDYIVAGVHQLRQNMQTRVGRPVELHRVYVRSLSKLTIHQRVQREERAGRDRNAKWADGKYMELGLTVVWMEGRAFGLNPYALCMEHYGARSGAGNAPPKDPRLNLPSHAHDKVRLPPSHVQCRTVSWVLKSAIQDPMIR